MEKSEFIYFKFTRGCLGYHTGSAQRILKQKRDFLPSERAQQSMQRVALLQHAYHCCRRFLQWTAQFVRSFLLFEHGAVSASVRTHAAGSPLFGCDARQIKKPFSSIYNKVGSAGMNYSARLLPRQGQRWRKSCFEESWTVWTNVAGSIAYTGAAQWIVQQKLLCIM